MNLFILRHGDAEAVANSDSERKLTQRGREETQKVALWLEKKNPKIEIILSSPYIRARQTALIVAEELKLTNFLKYLEALTPEKTPEDVLGVLKDIPQNNVLIVGHLPLFGYLISALVSGEDQKEVTVKKSGLSLIELPEIKYGAGQLMWMVTPDIL